MSSCNSKTSLLRSSLVFSFITLLSRITGYLRDMLLAACFGASPGMDAFVIAFRLPNLFRRLFAEGAFAQSFIPVVAEYQANKPNQNTKFIAAVMGNLAMVLAIVTAVGIVFAPKFIEMLSPGFSSSGIRLELAVTMLRWTFPYLWFIGITAFLSSLLQVKGKFVAGAFAPILLNLSLIIGAYGGVHSVAAELGLAYAVSIAGALQLMFVYKAMPREMLVRPRIDWHDPGVKRVLALMLPAMLGAAVHQINLLVDSWFASFLPIGSISWVYYADRLLEFPLALIGVALTTVMMPKLSQLNANTNTQGFLQVQDWGIKLALLLATPAAVGLYVLATPLVAILFGRGKFTNADIQHTASCLQAYAPAIVAIIVVKVFATCFYAKQNLKFPVKISIFIMLINLGANALLVKKFAHNGLAMATSASSLVQMMLLFYGWRSYYGNCLLADWPKFVGKVILANLIMLVVLLGLLPNSLVWLQTNNVFSSLVLCGIIMLAASSYFLALLAMGVNWRMFWQHKVATTTQIE